MVNSLFDIQGQTAVITGGSGVLGSAMAHGPAGAGATVVVIGLHGEKTSAVVEAISAQGGQALAIACNVLERADLQQALEHVTATFGPVDILVNGAGGNAPQATTSANNPFFELDRAAIDSVFALNFTGTLLSCQVFGYAMAERGQGDRKSHQNHPFNADDGKDEGDRKGPLPSLPNPRPYNDYGGGSNAGWGPLRSLSSLIVHVTTDSNYALPVKQNKPDFVLCQPYLATMDAGERLAGLAASFMGWQLSMALFGYLHDITFAGQPAVENYKARARGLRMQENPLSVLELWSAQSTEGILTLYGPGTIFQAQGVGGGDDIAKSFARVLREASTAQRLDYLDGTLNGEASPAFLAMFGHYLRRTGNERLGIPVKLRRAPADYHSTEQSEMDGPPWLVSLRLLAREHEGCMVGHYDDTFLLAQAVSTWQAMLEQGRSCFLLVVDGALEDAMESLTQFFERVINVLELQ